ncbi:MAG TPA: beta-N-acetylhexosaminidase [Ktedonobacteraceae bacterium]|nr:beta-N-acetylhexosaminidase [Ktedonobacteraceae bacterium]
MSNYTDGMTLEERIGQVLMVGFPGTTASREVIELIQRYHVGNIILFSRNVRDAEQVRSLTHQLQKAAREAGHPYPLLIAIDQENGIVQRLGEAATLFPGNMALGAIGSEEVASEVALATGRELKALGINMNLAPVVDVSNNAANPVIGVRSFGEDPQLVARLGAVMVKGYQEAGIISCLKHFPGHGDTAVDSHLALPLIPHSLERLEAVELVPFRRGIAAGAESVMVAHTAFPALTHDDALPATLSSAIIQGLLREQMGFEGVIVSDCLEMRAISDTFGSEPAAVMALQAGIDLVLVSHTDTRQRGSFEAIREAVLTGELSAQVVQRAAERIMELKARYLSWDTTAVNIDYAAHAQLQDRAYELSTTLVRNEDALLPLRLQAGENIVIVSPARNTMTKVEDRFYSDEMLLNILQAYSSNVRLQAVASEADYEKLMSSTNEKDIFIVATVNAHLDEAQANVVRFLIASKRRVIGIAVRNPYDLQAFPQLRTYLATYEYTRPALIAAARVLFGEREARGHLPVSVSA